MSEATVRSNVAAHFDIDSFVREVSGRGLAVRVGPFNAHITASVPRLYEPLYALYADYPLLDHADVFSFHARITPRRNLPRFYRRMVRFAIEGRLPHEDMPEPQSLAVLEWGINLVIALRAHCFLMLHSAVLERDGFALLLPAAPGSGKSTLCSALAHRGWRLLSDEFGLIRPHTTDFVPIPRPVALKNESIDVFRAFAPSAHVGPSIPGTRKGTVAHVKAPADSIRRQADVAPPRWVVFPKWSSGSSLKLKALSKSEGFMMLAMNAFNYDLLGEAAYDTVATLVKRSDCYNLEYSDLEEAVSRIEELAVTVDSVGT